MPKILFLGSIQWGKPATGGGAQSKNQHFLKYLLSTYEEIEFVDFWGMNVGIALIRVLLKILLVKPDNCVIISMSSRYSTYISRFCQMLRLKRRLFLWVIGGEFPDIISRYSDKRRLSLNYYEKVVVQGEYIKMRVACQGVNNCVVVPNFKDIIFRPTERKRTDTLKCVYLSRIIPEKGVDTIINAIKDIDDPKVSVDFYGALNSPYSKEYFNNLSSWNISYGGFLKLDTEDGYKKLAEYDIMLFPTEFKGEGFPGVLIDSFIAGVPVIATDFRINCEVVKDGYNGILIAKQDVELLKEKILLIIKQPRLLEDLRKNAIMSASSYEVHKVIGKAFKDFNIA